MIESYNLVITQWSLIALNLSGALQKEGLQNFNGLTDSKLHLHL